MDLNSLRQFLVVARLEHLSGAADELRVAQPSLSRTIARLENELGTPLFDRGGRLRLNDAGRLFRGHVERALGELDAGRRAVADAAVGGLGSVRMASETFITLTGPLAAFKRAHPSVEVGLYPMSAPEMGRRLRAQDIDLCVASQALEGEGLESVRLLDERVLLTVAPDHPLAGRASVAVEEIAGEPFITGRKGHWQRRLLDRLFAEKDLEPRIICEGDEPGTIQMLISAGLGIGLNPAMARLSASQSPVAWVELDSPSCRRRLTLLWNADARLSAAADLMRTTIARWDWTAGAPKGC